MTMPDDSRVFFTVSLVKEDGGYVDQCFDYEAITADNLFSGFTEKGEVVTSGSGVKGYTGDIYVGFPLTSCSSYPWAAPAVEFGLRRAARAWSASATQRPTHRAS
jgi:hypothetical protein